MYNIDLRSKNNSIMNISHYIVINKEKVDKNIIEKCLKYKNSIRMELLKNIIMLQI